MPVNQLAYLPVNQSWAHSESVRQTASQTVNLIPVSQAVIDGQ